MSNLIKLIDENKLEDLIEKVARTGEDFGYADADYNLSAGTLKDKNRAWENLTAAKKELYEYIMVTFVED